MYYTYIYICIYIYIYIYIDRVYSNITCIAHILDPTMIYKLNIHFQYIVYFLITTTIYLFIDGKGHCKHYHTLLDIIMLITL